MALSDIWALISGSAQADEDKAAKNVEDYLSQMEKVGYTPERIQAAVEDQVARNAQLEALKRMQNIAAAGGLTAQDKARRLEIDRQIDARNRANQLAIQQNMAQRGIGGSGAEIAQQMLSAQGGAQTRSQSGLQTAADAESRALQAITGSAGMAGNLRGQDQSSLAAQNAINQFNAANATQAARYGAESKAGALAQRYTKENQDITEARRKRRQAEADIGGLFGNVVNFATSPTNPFGWFGSKKEQ